MNSHMMWQYLMPEHDKVLTNLRVEVGVNSVFGSYRLLPLARRQCFPVQFFIAGGESTHYLNVLQVLQYIVSVLTAFIRTAQPCPRPAYVQLTFTSCSTGCRAPISTCTGKTKRSPG
ncbi:hypothetical protein C8Q78DRAFT_1041533 [Trametes maxima]|nr:hypothetical protein C8Q78DRAFT_1041533 [Trametes maxima]